MASSSSTPHRKSMSSYVLGLLNLSGQTGPGEAETVYEKRIEKQPLYLYPTDKPPANSGDDVKLQKNRAVGIIKTGLLREAEKKKANAPKPAGIIMKDSRRARGLARQLRREQSILKKKKLMKERRKRNLRRRKSKEMSDEQTGDLDSQPVPPAATSSQPADVEMTDQENDGESAPAKPTDSSSKKFSKTKDIPKRNQRDQTNQQTQKTNTGPKTSEERIAEAKRTNQHHQYLLSLVTADREIDYDAEEIDSAATTTTITRPNPMSAAEKKRTQLYQLGPDACNYDVYISLCTLWFSYINDLLGINPLPDLPEKPVNVQEYTQKLSAADYHGAFVTVMRAKCVTRVGIAGIIVRETKSSFLIVTKKNEIKIVPKENTVFLISIGGHPDDAKKLSVMLYGSNLLYRAADRGGRKFKSKATSDL
ncbi:hypothetical protein BZA70DRAFT_285265 [Myxozyma melibiosi]|uniref:Uncharacterized protein n=1 Tax=Myxozyma melibiosi TaxID=54550 RepID=A0ABR1EY94_9ASCO